MNALQFPKPAARKRNPDYMARVRELPCLLSALGDCQGRVEADHTGPRGLSRKADDETCIPLCSLHHHQRTNFTGVFRSFDKDVMRLWCAWAAATTRKTLGVAR